MKENIPEAIIGGLYNPAAFSVSQRRLSFGPYPTLAPPRHPPRPAPVNAVPTSIPALAGRVSLSYDAGEAEKSPGVVGVAPGTDHANTVVADEIVERDDPRQHPPMRDAAAASDARVDDGDAIPFYAPSLRGNRGRQTARSKAAFAAENQLADQQKEARQAAASVSIIPTPPVARGR